MPRDQRGHTRGLPLGTALDIEPLLQRDLRHQNEHDDTGLSRLAATAGGEPARGDPGIIRDQQRGTATAIDEPKLQAGSPLPAFRRDLFSRPNGVPSALAGGGGWDRQEQTARRADHHATVKGIDDLWRPRPDIGCGLGTLAHLGEGLSPPCPRQPFAEPGRDDILAEILLQAIGSIAHPRRDCAFDIPLGLCKGFAEVGYGD